jgi:hypothetical protein
MNRKLLFPIVLLLFFLKSQSQEKKQHFQLGFNYGFGSEIKNSNYSYTNQYFKLELNYLLKKTKSFQYEIVLQPEINFATHQLLNLYFVKPSEANYQQKRDDYTKLKNIREYILNIGFLVRKPITNSLSIYVLGSVGPLIIDTETERLSKGFAFSDVLAIGIDFRSKQFSVGIRPSVRHLSNAGLQGANAGFNTKNIEFCIAVPL